MGELELAHMYYVYNMYHIVYVIQYLEQEDIQKKETRDDRKPSDWGCQ